MAYCKTCSLIDKHMGPITVINCPACDEMPREEPKEAPVESAQDRLRKIIKKNKNGKGANSCNCKLNPSLCPDRCGCNVDSPCEDHVPF